MTNNDDEEDAEYLELVRLEDEFIAMCDEYDAARRAKKYDVARQLGKEVRAFARLHQHTLVMTDEQLDKLVAVCRAQETRWIYEEISESYFKKSERRAQEIEEEHNRLLLEKPPQGRKRTAH